MSTLGRVKALAQTAATALACAAPWLMAWLAACAAATVRLAAHGEVGFGQVRLEWAEKGEHPCVHTRCQQRHTRSWNPAALGSPWAAAEANALAAASELLPRLLALAAALATARAEPAELASAVAREKAVAAGHQGSGSGVRHGWIGSRAVVGGGWAGSLSAGVPRPPADVAAA